MNNNILKTVAEVVYEVVCELTNNDPNYIFSQKALKEAISKKYPNFRLRSVESCIIKDCVNHDSHEHHTPRNSYYEKVGRGKYRLYK